MISGIDHIALIVRDLDDTVLNYQALLGRSPNWRGALEGAQHAWFQLPNMGLDIIAPQAEGRFGELARARLEGGGEGIWALGFAVDDLDEASRTVRRRGIAVSERTELISEGANGQKRAWSYTSLSAGLSMFLVQKSREGQPVSPPLASEADAIQGLDHIVIRTSNAERAAALFGARLGLDLRLDRSNEQWGSRLLFFRCGDLVVEIAASLHVEQQPASDTFGGLAWRTRNANATRRRLERGQFDVSELRQGRKQGTQVFTVRSHTASIPTLVLEQTSPR
jgi:catechol 2,3-dioxygenase-like lactoylglutathione lyase family enzyme